MLSRTSRSCCRVHGGSDSSPSESHLRTTGGDTSQTAAACRTENTEPFSTCLRLLTLRTLASPQGSQLRDPSPVADLCPSALAPGSPLPTRNFVEAADHRAELVEIPSSSAI
jgi:hypothetical protein